MKLVVEGFKSIVRADLEVKPLTILIGPPDTGKSNLLEALGLLSFIAYGGSVEDYFRYPSLSAVFSLIPGSPMYVRVVVGGFAEITLEQRPDLRGVRVTARCTVNGQKAFIVDYGFDGTLRAWPGLHVEEAILPAVTALLNIRFYRFHAFKSHLGYTMGPSGFALRMLTEASPEVYRELPTTILLPPRGSNLPWLIVKNPEAKRFVQAILEDHGYHGIATIKVPRPQGPLVEVPHSVLGEATYIPLDLLSDGLQIYIAVSLALTQRLPEALEERMGWMPTVIILEEPEIHLYPYKLVDLARLMASAIRERENTYVVLSTHNMHMVATLLSKTPRERIAVYYTQRTSETGETIFKRLDNAMLEELLSEGPGALPLIEEILSTAKP